MEERTKRKKGLERHIVICPHCQKEALDHMTKCPNCEGTLIPRGYSPMMDEATQKRVKLITTIILSVVAVIVLVLYFAAKKSGLI